MKPYARLVYLTIPAAMLFACGTPDVLPYRAPNAGQPSVQLTVAPPVVPLSRHDSEQLSRHHVECGAEGVASAERMALTSWSPYPNERAPKIVAVPVGRVYFRYVRNGNSKSCGINFSASLEAGHAYAIETTRTFGGFFKDSQCMLKMVDSSTGEPVPLDHESAQPNFQPACNKQRSERSNPVVARN
jgi:hypothetical protein